ncbi:MAG: MOSC domain-containing protein, partial [Campylobacterota bacterium]|nr:MOSC domain-containing protein [Campylobacterota bacterium]
MELTHIITGEAKKPLQYLSSCEAVKGKGLKGDRYYNKTGTFNKPQLDQSVREISILPYESLQECNDRLDSSLEFKELRRNLVIKNFDYEKLKNKEFQIGTAIFKIVRTAPPCRYLSKLLDEDMMKGLKYIGGYRAVVVQSGLI